MNYAACFAFLRFALVDTAPLPAPLTVADWHDIYLFGTRQALLGVLYEGVLRLPAGIAPPQELLLSWVVVANKIRQQNIRANEAAGELYRQFTRDGFRCCLLKGQSNALLYDNVYARTAGDVDLWLCGYKDAAAEGGYIYPSYDVMCRKVISYARQHFSVDKIRGHHVMFWCGDMEVEAHFRPSERAHPLYNNRYTRWFHEQMAAQCEHYISLPDDAGQVATPTLSFNLIYHLAHLFRHFFDMGIGMRQIVDYWHVLRQYNGTAEEDKEQLRHTLRYLGQYTFAGAVMWVLQETLHLPTSQTLVPADARRGRLLLAEIINGGNFGKYDTKYGNITRKNIGNKYFTKTIRNLSFLPYYPMEALCEPFYRTYHFFLRKARRW